MIESIVEVGLLRLAGESFVPPLHPPTKFFQESQGFDKRVNEKYLDPPSTRHFKIRL